MEEGDQRELQLLPTPSSTHLSGRTSGTSGRSRSMADHFDGPPLDLQLSISLRPIRPPPPPTPADCVLPRPLPEHGNMKIDFTSSIEVLKWQAAEQIRLAAVEKAYAERVKELTRREMELAQSEFARARQMWERARQEVEKAERLKERAARHIDSTCMEITCQVCRQRFRP
ncbi:hypothetical protein BVC80_9101g59 [Macleaya cordata]|uniref:Protein SHOOT GRAVITROPISM 5 n=1 Tax=Macleaya cordata TaxID=56857 RepID=A0A200QGM2_MACCD|nr:hypothetical protein BVC80_9101g59 [Macleaya cordata]